MKPSYAFSSSVDLGTTGCRSVLFDDALHTLGIAYEESTLITPKEGWTEQDANVWWNMTKSTAKAAIAKAGVDGKAVRGISISSQGITIVPVDEALNPLCNALSWLDVRAEEQTARIECDFGGEAIFTLTGKPINACYTLPTPIRRSRSARSTTASSPARMPANTSANASPRSL